MTEYTHLDRQVPSRAASSTWAALVVAVAVLIGVVLAFTGIRIAEDWPVIAAGRLPPPEEYQYRYVAHPVLAYLHILPGAITASGLLSYPASFAPGFWVAFTMHAVAAELYLRWRPGEQGRVVAAA